MHANTHKHGHTSPFTRTHKSCSQVCLLIQETLSVLAISWCELSVPQAHSTVWENPSHHIYINVHTHASWLHPYPHKYYHHLSDTNSNTKLFQFASWVRIQLSPSDLSSTSNLQLPPTQYHVHWSLKHTHTHVYILIRFATRLLDTNKRQVKYSSRYRTIGEWTTPHLVTQLLPLT